MQHKESSTKNGKAWELLFEKYNILEKISSLGSYVIKSSEINYFREARLMTKFDHSSQLPHIFSNNKLSLLPISRGEYVISDIQIFSKFPQTEVKIKDIEPPLEWESLEYKNITSESSAINCAYVGNLLQDFLEEEVLFPTVNGRMSSEEFAFVIERFRSNTLFEVQVQNSQIEIDGGYEGYNSFSLIEAKNTLAPDFLIRQVYYPYRLWEKKIGKRVRNIFLTYTNGIFHFREFIFTDLNRYNSIELFREKKYRFKETSSDIINIEFLQYLIENLPTVTEPEIPFPQADSFERVINLCEVIQHSGKDGQSKEELLTDFYFTDQESLEPRQVDYYTNAAAYLGFIKKAKRDDGTIVYLLTERGDKLFELSIMDRQAEFIKSILEHGIFSEVLDKVFQKGDILSREEVVSCMKIFNLFNIKSESTFNRRASTITSWVNWILEQIEE